MTHIVLNVNAPVWSSLWPLLWAPGASRLSLFTTGKIILHAYYNMAAN